MLGVNLDVAYLWGVQEWNGTQVDMRRQSGLCRSWNGNACSLWEIVSNWHKNKRKQTFQKSKEQSTQRCRQLCVGACSKLEVASAALVRLEGVRICGTCTRSSYGCGNGRGDAERRSPSEHHGVDGGGNFEGDVASATF